MSTKAKVSANPKSTKKELTTNQIVNYFKNEIKSVSFCVKSVNSLFHTTIETKDGKISGSKLATALVPNWKNSNKFDMPMFISICKAANYMVGNSIATYQLTPITFENEPIFADASLTKAIKVYTLKEVNSWTIAKVLNILLEISEKQAKVIKRNSDAVKAAKAVSTFYYSKAIEVRKTAKAAVTATTKAAEKAEKAAEKETHFVKNAVLKLSGTKVTISNKDFTTGTAKVNTKVNEVLSKESFEKAKKLSAKIDAEIEARKKAAEEKKKAAEKAKTEKAAES